ncbi:hypothetical protein BH23ACT5_BH23ACT5_24020 [soil metagenome]
MRRKMIATGLAGVLALSLGACVEDDGGGDVDPDLQTTMDLGDVGTDTTTAPGG